MTVAPHLHRRFWGTVSLVLKGCEKGGLLMLKIKPLPNSSYLWGAFNKTGQQVLFIDRNRPGPECEVRKYALKHPQGRGPLLATFLGPDSFGKACKWAKYYIPKSDVGYLNSFPVKGKASRTKLKSQRKMGANQEKAKKKRTAILQ
jgi:hypothetical protein